MARIFQEFEGHYADNEVHGSGDVKYHLGTEGVFTAEYWKDKDLSCSNT
jgi:2-oxoglutarate dehydrogenase E1 component